RLVAKVLRAAGADLFGNFISRPAASGTGVLLVECNLCVANTFGDGRRHRGGTSDGGRERWDRSMRRAVRASVGHELHSCGWLWQGQGECEGQGVLQGQGVDRRNRDVLR